MAYIRKCTADRVPPAETRPGTAAMFRGSEAMVIDVAGLAEAWIAGDHEVTGEIWQLPPPARQLVLAAVGHGSYSHESGETAKLLANRQLAI